MWFERRGCILTFGTGLRVWAHKLHFLKGEKMSYESDRQYTFSGAELEARKKRAVEEAVCRFLGASSASVQEDGTIKCYFKAESLDDCGSETRVHVISEGNPEKTVKTILTALGQQRWYQEKRDASQTMTPKELVYGDKATEEINFAVADDDVLSSDVKLTARRSS